MEETSKCLIDNWSLEASGELLEGDFQFEENSKFSFTEKIGCLSNLINAIILYDSINILDNTTQVDWEQFFWNKTMYGERELYDWNNKMELEWKQYHNFTNKVSDLFKEIKADNYDDYNYSYLTGDAGAGYYFKHAISNNCELIVSPHRVERIKKTPDKKIGINSPIFELLKRIDKEIANNASNLVFSNATIGIRNNFKVPSFTHLVLAEASNKNDIIDVARQFRNSKEIKSLKEVVEDAKNNYYNIIDLQREIDNLLDRMLGRKRLDNQPWGIGINLLFLTLQYSFNVNFKKRKRFIALLKDLVSHKLELNNSLNHIKRIFGADRELE